MIWNGEGQGKGSASKNHREGSKFALDSKPLSVLHLAVLDPFRNLPKPSEVVRPNPTAALPFRNDSVHF
jgi:hypothetical protein